MIMTRRALIDIALLVPLGSFLGAGCDGSGAVGDTTSDTTEMTTAALAAPPASCLTEQQCVNYPCPNGNRYQVSPGNLVFAETSSWLGYGSAACPGYYVLDILNSSTLVRGNASIQVRPVGTAEQTCPNGTLNVYVYGHSASGWTQVPGLTASQTCVFAQGTSGIPWVLDDLGGLPQYDRLRILIGATGSNGGVLGFSDQLIGCVPRTCSSYPGLCGVVSNLCGGTITCTCVEPPPPEPTPCRGRFCS